MSETPIQSGDEIIAEEFGLNVPKNKESTPTKRKKEEENVEYISFLETPDYILEQIKNATVANHAIAALEGVYEFLKYNKHTGSIDKIKSFEYQNRLYYPIIDDTVSKGGVLLPTEAMEFKDTKEIILQIKNFLHEYVELTPFYEAFFPNLVLFYWVYEKFPFIPYIQFVGRTATGKTTAMEVLGSICYKPIDTTGSLTIASIFRTATNWKGTLLIDEFESIGENSKEIVSFLKSGVSDRLVLRTEGEAKKEVKAYVVKAPKIFTSETPISDAGLQSRTLVIKMEKNKRRIPLFRLPNYFEEAQEIRNKLLLWRFQNFNKINLKDIEFGFEELKAFDRRVQQVITPVYYFSDDETKKEILIFAKQQEEETKRERRENLDGKIFEYLCERNEPYLALSVLTEEINKDKKMPVGDRRIAATIRTVLGFKINKVGHDNIRTIFFDNYDRIIELSEYYGLEVPPSPAAIAQVAEVAVEPEQESMPF